MNPPSSERQVIKPVQLHVLHNLGGGIERWMRDYSRSDDARTNLVLTPLEDQSGLYSGLQLAETHNDPTALRTWHFSMPIAQTAITHAEYRQALIELLDQYAVDVIVVSSLIGHSLDILASGLPTVVVHHDYYPYCAAVNITLGSQCKQCGFARLSRCFWLNSSNRIADGYCAQEWMLLRDAYFTLIRAAGVKLVVPSASVRDNLMQLDARYQELPWAVIPHGSDMPGEAERTVKQLDDSPRKMRVMVLGVIVQHKGEDLLREVVSKLGEIIDFYLIGCGSAGKDFERLGAREVIENFEHAQLPRIMEHVAPDMGLLLSTVPETFSYTLSEMRVFNVPVLATSLGSFPERIEDGRTGFLVQPLTSDILRRLKQLNEDRDLLTRVSGNLKLEPRRDAKAMVADYHRLFDLSHRKEEDAQSSEKLHHQLQILAAGELSLPVRFAAWRWNVLLPFRWFVRKVTNVRHKFLRSKTK